MTCYVGIDPGKIGAVVLLAPSGNLIKSWVAPMVSGRTKAKADYDIPGMRTILQALAPRNVFVFLEKSQTLPPKMGGGSANFHRGRSFSLWEGLLAGLFIRYEIVGPQKWQKTMFSGMDYRDTKQAALLIAGRLWPKENWLASSKSRKPHEGLIDAALIGEFGRRLHAGSRRLPPRQPPMAGASQGPPEVVLGSSV